MKKNFSVLFVLFMTAFIPLHLQAQTQGMDVFRQDGIASWYGKEFDGRPTASGEIYDSSKLTAAHPNLPFGTMLVVTNRHNDKKVTVRVNDRGPFVAARVIDVSRAAAEQLDMIVTGTAPVSIESIERIVVSSPPVVEQVQTPAPAQASAQTSAQASAQAQVQIQEALPADTAPIAQAPITRDLPAATNAPPPASDSIPAVVDTYVQQPVVPQVYPQVYNQIKLTPEINIAYNKTYRLQVGSYRVARNAVDAFEKLKNSGLTPAYERYTDSENGEYFRVVLAGISGTDVQSIIERLGLAGFKEALIREEN